MNAPTIAIIGASNDRRKYGNKAVRAYKAAGYAVYPVHPGETLIEGLPVYRSVLDIPVDLDVVSLYIQPEHVEKTLEDIARKNPGEVFFNPGTEGRENLSRARELGLNAVQGCSIIASGRIPEDFE